MLLHSSGSVIADIKLTNDGSLGTPEEVLELARTVIPFMSDNEPKTTKVEAACIVLRKFIRDQSEIHVLSKSGNLLISILLLILIVHHLY